MSPFVFISRSAARLSVLAALVLLSLPARADDSLSGKLDAILAAPALHGGITGAVVERISDQKILYSRNSDLRLMPASNRKLFTAAAALKLLGPKFRFQTHLLVTALPDANGVLAGDLYLRGAGDSALSKEDLAKMVDAVVKAGVKQIAGGVYGDGTCFTDGPYGIGWGWDYLSDDYAPQIAGLEIERGDIAVHVAATEPGRPPRVTLDPDTAYIPVVNEATTGAKGTEATCDVARPWDKNIINVKGTVPEGGKFDISITVADPPLYAATVLREMLIRAGIIVTRNAYTSATPPAASHVLASHVSVPLSEYVALMDKPSDNLLAESLVRMIGVRAAHTGTYDAGHEEELALFAKIGIPERALDFRDGCGVSRLDVVTANSVMKLLIWLYHEPTWQALYDSLPIAGRDGTLRSRMKHTKAEGNVHAKTGSLTGASCLSGYLTGHDGALYAFSLLMNNFPCKTAEARAVQDKFVEDLVGDL